MYSLKQTYVTSAVSSSCVRIYRMFGMDISIVFSTLTRKSWLSRSELDQVDEKGERGEELDICTYIVLNCRKTESHAHHMINRIQAPKLACYTLSLVAFSPAALGHRSCLLPADQYQSRLTYLEGLLCVTAHTFLPVRGWPRNMKGEPRTAVWSHKSRLKTALACRSVG